MSKSASLEDLVELLRRCLVASDSVERERLIGQFQRPIWDSADITGDDRIDEVLADAALDLDYYEPRDDWRAEDRSYYDDVELDMRLRSILRDLGFPEGGDA